MALVQATPEKFVMKGSFVIPDHGPSSGATNPVIASRRLYIRDNNRLHCYDVNAGAILPADPVSLPRTISLDVAAAAARASSVSRVDPVRETQPPRGVFVPTPHDVVLRMLQLAVVKKSDVVCDLGSGDGRILIAAAKEYGCKALGYEIDAELVSASRQTATDKGVKQLVTIERADIFTADLSQVDVVTLYLLPSQNEKLIPQLRKMKAGSRIVAHQFEIPGIKSERMISVESQETGEKHQLYLYRLPLPRIDED